MKHNLIAITVVTSALIFSNASLADETTQQVQPSKQWNIGVGTYALIIDEDNSDDITFEGFALSATYAFNDNVSIKGQYYALEEEDFSEIELSGVDMAVHYGTGLASDGFKAYIGLGLYSETLEVGSLEEDFSGAQIAGGLGYNWESVSLDLSLGIRSTGDYEDLADDSSDVTAVSSSLVFAIRF